MVKDVEQTRIGIFDGSRKWFIATAVGIGTGLTKFVTDVRSEFYENVMRGPDFKKQVEEHGIRLGQIKDERRAGITDTETFIKKFKHQKDEFAHKTQVFAEELGIKSSGVGGWVEGTIQRFQTLSQNARAPVVFGAITTTVIGFAGTSMFINGLANRSRLKEIAKHPTVNIEQHAPDYNRS